jgi:hypothetical protein
MYQRIETFIAATMFLLAILFLAIAAILVQYLQTDFSIAVLPYFDEMFHFLFGLWLLFIVERVLYLIFCSHNRLQALYFSLLIMLFPPLRLATHRCQSVSEIWIYPRWHPVNPILFEELETWFLYVTLSVSLLMLPFWLLEIFQADALYENLLLHHFVNLGNAFIWGTFVAEFIIELSITSKRGEYLLKHWLELFIIILPMMMLTRFVRLGYMANMLGLESVAELQFFKLAKLRQMLSLYRARVVFNRVLRMLVLIDLFRLWQQRRHPQQYLRYLQEKLAYHQEQIVEIQHKIEETQQLIADQQKTRYVS